MLNTSADSPLSSFLICRKFGEHPSSHLPLQRIIHMLFLRTKLAQYLLGPLHVLFMHINTVLLRRTLQHPAFSYIFPNANLLALYFYSILLQ